MLRTALNHRKFRRLATVLNIPRFAAVGLAECLWHLTATQAPQGDIGKLSNAEIAEGVFWPKRSASKLIEALTSPDISLLDSCKCHRLRVHDWNCHADQSVKKTLSKHRKSFCSCYSPDPRSGTVPEQARNDSGLPEPEPEPEPEPLTQSPPSSSVDSKPETPTRTDADDARAELREALQAFREFVDTGESDQVILELPKFHSSSGGIVRIETCTNAGLMRAVAAKVRAKVKPRKATGAPGWDRGPQLEADSQSAALAWVRDHWPADADPQTKADLYGLAEALKPPDALLGPIKAHLLFGCYPHLRNEPEPGQETPLANAGNPIQPALKSHAA